MKKISFKSFLFLVLIFTSCSNVSNEATIKIENQEFYDNYKPATTSSLGYLTLNPEKTISEQIKNERFVYEVISDFDLNGDNLIIPNNCTLKFSGGMIRNGTLNFSNTTLQGYVQFKNCNYEGSLANSEVQLSWFNILDGEKNSIIIGNKQTQIETSYPQMLNQIFNISKNKTVIFDKVYYITDTLNIDYPITLKGCDYNEGIYSTMNQNMQYGIYYVDKGLNAYKSLLNAKNGSQITMYGITLGRNIQQYISGNLWDKEYLNGSTLSKPIQACGINLESGAKINQIHDSSFYGFTYGIKAQKGSSIVYIKNTYFSSNRFGFWGDSVSSIQLKGCRFNTNMLNFPFYKRNLLDRVREYNGDTEHIHPLEYSDGDQVRGIGGGIYLRNCSDVNVDNCRFEFNFIHLIIDEAGTNIYANNCIFDTGTISQVMIYNGKGNRNPNSSNVYNTSQTMSNINITNNTFARGARCDVKSEKSKPGFSILYLVEENNRGSSINFSNNIISDDMEVDTSIDVTYETNIFLIQNDSTNEKGILNVKGNSFLSAMATNIFYFTENSTGKYKINYQSNEEGTLENNRISGKQEVAFINY